jgi:hypothetical protein
MVASRKVAYLNLKVAPPKVVCPKVAFLNSGKPKEVEDLMEKLPVELVGNFQVPLRVKLTNLA